MSVQEIRSCRTNDTFRRDTKSECGHNGRKDRDSYLFLTRKLVTWRYLQTVLKAGGVNDLSVVTVVDESFTTEQTVSVSLGNHGKEVQTQILS